MRHAHFPHHYATCSPEPRNGNLLQTLAGLLTYELRFQYMVIYMKMYFNCGLQAPEWGSVYAVSFSCLGSEPGMSY